MRRIGPKAILLCTALLPLAACATSQAVAPTDARLRGVSAAYALPPPGGPSVVGVVERGYSNARAQRIMLATEGATPGQNQLDVAMFGLGPATGDNVLAPPALTDANMSIEMRAALAGVPMEISPFFVRNAYGPFGYAIGRGAGRDLCMYAWQRLDSSPQPFKRQEGVSVRMRICQPGATEASLLANMYDYTMIAPLGRSGQRLVATAGGAGAYPSATRHIETVLQPTMQVAVAAPPRVQETRPEPPPGPAAVVAQANALPAAFGPLVPPPVEVPADVARTAAQEAPTVPAPPQLEISR